MHLAILMANTDDSDFAHAHPGDGEKWRRLIARVRPDWQLTTVPVKDGVFPDDPSAFDGFIVTGSPASVNDPDPWVGRLLALIRDLAAARRPVYGACFGHQAIALALGGRVGDNPDGWVFGRVDSTAALPWQDTPRALSLYAAHREQVTALPPGARPLGKAEGCPVAGFAIGRHVLTTQYHPEMTPDFIAALVDHLDGTLPPEVIARARASLTAPADDIAADIAGFFDRA